MVKRCLQYGIVYSFLFSYMHPLAKDLNPVPHGRKFRDATIKHVDVTMADLKVCFEKLSSLFEYSSTIESVYSSVGTKTSVFLRFIFSILNSCSSHILSWFCGLAVQVPYSQLCCEEHS